MFLVFVLLTLIFLIFTLLPIQRSTVWWIRGLDFPRLQIFIAITILVGVEILLLDFSTISAWLLVLTGLFCAAYQAWWIIPYIRVFPKEVKSTKIDDPLRRIKIIIANVLTSNRNSSNLIEQVRQNKPDILVTLESDCWWQSQLDVLEDDYPYTVKCPLDNLYGMHVYSRFPLMNTEIEYLVEDDRPSIHALVMMPSGHKVRAHFLHPAPPSPTENLKSSERDAELIIVAKSVAESKIPIIVTGDLNDVAWSETTRLFRKISGLLDPRIGRGMFNTFHAEYWFLRWPLDHIFHSHHFTLQQIRRLKKFGSDHFALLTELVVETDVNDDNDLKPDADDLAWAQAKARKHHVSKYDVPEPEKLMTRN
ncbi:MAG: endonuclease [Nitrosomonas sp. PRO4]|nr:endonuclease [Nitrosomonas sp. PRO4]